MNSFPFTKKYFLLLALFFSSMLMLLYNAADEGKSEGSIVHRVEKALMVKEKIAEKCLSSLDSLGDFGEMPLEEGLSLLVIQDSSVLYWSDERICSDSILTLLAAARPVIFVNNSYYEVKCRELWDSRFYIFIHIKDRYPVSQYRCRDRFAKYMAIPVENAEQITLQESAAEGDKVVHDMNGRELFSLHFPEDFHDQHIEYWKVVVYILIFILIFIVYDKFMAEEPSVVRQLIYFALFSLALCLLYYYSFTSKTPADLFKLPVFERKTWNSYPVTVSVGEILVYVYSMFQLMSITIFRVNSNKRKLRPFRFVIAALWILFTYLYVSLYSFAIKAMIEQFDVCTNVAWVVNIGVVSFVVLVTVVLGGIALIIAEDRVFSVYVELLSFKEIIAVTAVVSLMLFLPSLLKFYFVGFYTWLFYSLLAIVLLCMKYYLKPDMQRNVYLIILLSYSVYLISVMKGLEQNNERIKREHFAEWVLEINSRNGIEASIQDQTEVLNYYIYSYAKYDKEGNLLFSSGKFIYNKILTDWVPGIDSGETIRDAGFDHRIFKSRSTGETVVVSLPEYYFHSYYYLNILYIFFLSVLLSSYSLIHHLNEYDRLQKREVLKNRIKNNINILVFALFLVLTVCIILFNSYSFRNRERFNAVNLIQSVCQYFEEFRYGISDVKDERDIHEIATVLNTDIHLYDGYSGKLLATSNPEIFKLGYRGNRVNSDARRSIVEEGETIILVDEKVGNIKYKSVYANTQLSDGSFCIVNIPYFIENSEFNRDIATIAIIAINVAIVLMILSFTFSSLIANRILHPLKVISGELKKMRLDGKNARIVYSSNDEVGLLVRQYNETLAELETNVAKLAKSEREGAWREMARQIAHEIKNPLTPMKLNIQLLQKAIKVDEYDQFKARFKRLSDVIMEQIDTMAVTASAFSDFAKYPKAVLMRFDISALIRENIMLLKDGNIEFCDKIEDGIIIVSDKFLISRVFMNIIKNAEQSIPENIKGVIVVSLRREPEGFVRISVADNGCGIPKELRNRIFEPNFTTKSTGMGLGLAISRKIMESLEGDIYFENRTEGGAEFIITIKDKNE